MESFCCSLSCLQFPEFSGNCAVFIPRAVKLQPSTMLGFINKRTAITFPFFLGEGQEDKANQRLYFKFSLKRARADMCCFFHIPRSYKQFSCMFGTCFHMGKSLMGYNQIKKGR